MHISGSHCAEIIMQVGRPLCWLLRKWWRRWRTVQWWWTWQQKQGATSRPQFLENSQFTKWVCLGLHECLLFLQRSLLDWIPLGICCWISWSLSSTCLGSFILKSRKFFAEEQSFFIYICILWQHFHENLAYFNSYKLQFHIYILDSFHLLTSELHVFFSFLYRWCFYKMFMQ